MVALTKSAAGALLTTQRKVNKVLQVLTREGFEVTEKGEWEFPEEISHDLRHQITDAYNQILWLQEKVGVASGFKHATELKEQLVQIETFQKQLGTAIAKAMEKTA